jgi:hypothetical protein
MNLPRHALATLELYPSEDGARARPQPALPWRVDIRVGNETRIYYQTRVDLEPELHPGNVRQAYLTFGYPHIVGPRLEAGTRIFYCRGRPFAQGEILELYLSDEERKGDGMSVDDRVLMWAERDRVAMQKMIVALDALLERRISLTEGVRDVVFAAADARSVDSALLGPFTGVDSELMRFPVGEVRQYWHPYRLIELDAERFIEEKHYDALIMESAQRLLDWLHRRTGMV